MLPREIEAGKLAVAGEGADIVVDGVAGFVAVALIHQSLHEIDHLGDVVGGAGDEFGFGNIQAVKILHEDLGVEGGDLHRVFLLFARGLGHLILALVGIGGEVTDVGDVHAVFKIVAGTL